jgi:lantibiotic biosynthesis dehydratase-like protein
MARSSYLMTSSKKTFVDPTHLEKLVPGEWGVWRWFVLRGAGFPARLIEDLSQPNCGAAADVFFATEERLESAFAAAIVQADAALDYLKAQGYHTRDIAFRKVLKARNRLAEQKVPQEIDLPSDLGNAFKEINTAELQRDRARSDYELAFSMAVVRQNEALQLLAGDAMFQEAMVWQNRPAFETSVEPFSALPRSSARNQRQRHREETVAKYAQRYCVKNDTIGFFGPAVWARIEPDEQALKAVPGASLFEGRRTYFEAWAIDRLAMSLSLREGMQWWIPPLLAPDIRIEGGMLQRPGSSVQLTQFERAVLQLCDGRRLPDEILAILSGTTNLAVATKQALQEFLEAKAAEGILVWRFLVPVEINPELNLRQQLQRIGDVKLRETAMKQLNRLEAAREATSKAAGNPGRLNEALAKAEQSFAEITQSSGSRNPGATYGARTIFYEDCRRDFSLKITPKFIKPIVPALSLLFQSLRWLVRSIAEQLIVLFRNSFQELVEGKTARELPLLHWWLHTEPKLLNTASISVLEKLFTQKWTEVLKVDVGKDIVSFSSNELKAAVEQTFPEIESGYCPVRYFCPDLMLAAESVEAIHRGDVLYVLGEVHSGKNTLGHAALVQQHPDLQQLLQATEWDWGTPRFKILDTQQVETTTVRTSNALLCASDYLVATTPDSVPPSGFISHPISEFTIHEQGGELYVVSRRGGQRFHILEVFSDLFSPFVMNKGSWIPPLRYTPRILIDNLVIRRATWRFSANELEFAREKDESRRFLEARRWMKENGLPRRMFVRSATEVKPFYLDWDTPIFVEGLSHYLRVAQSLAEGQTEFAFSEMLPDLNQLWLRDGKDMSYTSELRFAFVDLKARAAGVASHEAMP